MADPIQDIKFHTNCKRVNRFFLLENCKPPRRRSRDWRAVWEPARTTWRFWACARSLWRINWPIGKRNFAASRRSITRKCNVHFEASLSSSNLPAYPLLLIRSGWNWASWGSVCCGNLKRVAGAVGCCRSPAASCAHRSYGPSRFCPAPLCHCRRKQVNFSHFRVVFR